jgi:cyclopropane-fatty-acyl-phospholipid synthase
MKKPKTAPLSLPDAAWSEEEATARSGARVTATERWLVHKLLELAGRPPLAVRLWNGEEITAESGERTAPPLARVWLRDRGALWRLAVHPDLHFGDLYSTGRVEVEGDLVRFLETAYSGVAAHTPPWLRRLRDYWSRPRANTPAGSRENIHHHYDLGNDFYALWLDREAMQYTCAYFPDPAMTLEQAQIAKMDHVCRKLQLKPGDRVIEAGCGWGGLARHMARHYGVTVRAYNISHEQIAYARAKAAEEGLADRVEYIEDDYRNITGRCDVFVSVGMLEHVGKENYAVLGAVIDRVLTDEGRGLIHTIGRNRPAPMNAWIERRIFPGAYPPTLREMMDIFEPNGFSVLDVENLRLHYAKTLEHWLARFEAHAAEIERRFDRRFVRAWRLYLAGSIAAFTTGSLQLFQVVFARARNNALPWSRAHLYCHA